MLSKALVKAKYVILATAISASSLFYTSSNVAADSAVCTGFLQCTNNHSYQQNYTNSHWRAYAGHNCTNYVGYMLKQNGELWSGFSSGAPSPGILMDDAGSWDNKIVQNPQWGYTINNTPAPGSIALWDPNSGPYIGDSGHVAYVEHVNNGSITISEDNYANGPYSWRIISSGSSRYPSKFLHIKDINITPPIVVSSVGTASTSGATYRQDNSYNGATQAFAQGPNNTLMAYHNTYGSQWSSGNQIGGTGSTFSKTSAVHNQNNGVTLVFAQGPNNSLVEYWNVYGNSNWYSATIAGPGTTYSAPSAVYNQNNGVTLVFAQGPNNSLVEHWNTYGQPTWSSANIAGAGTTYSAPSAVFDQTDTFDGFTQVFAQGANNSLATYWNTYGQPTWSSANIAGAGTTYSAPAAVYNQSNSFTQVFAQGANNTLQAYYTTPGTQWSSGNLIGGAGTTYSAPTAAYNQDNTQGGITLVFARGADNSLVNYHNLYGHSSWNGSIVEGTANTVYSEPASVYNQSNGFTQVFSMGPSNSLNHYWNTYGQTPWYLGNVAGVNSTYSAV